MAAEAHTMCSVLLITWKREFCIKMVVFQMVLTALRPAKANVAKGFIAC